MARMVVRVRSKRRRKSGSLSQPSAAVSPPVGLDRLLTGIDKDIRRLERENRELAATIEVLERQQGLLEQTAALTRRVERAVVVQGIRRQPPPRRRPSEIIRPSVQREAPVDQRLTEALKERPYASALVYLDLPLGASNDTRDRLRSYFVSSGEIHGLARGARTNAPPPYAPAVIFYENLGVALGGLTNLGLGGLRAEGEVSQVFLAPLIELVRPRHQVSLVEPESNWGITALEGRRRVE